MLTVDTGAVISDTETNQQPYLIDFGDRGVKWVAYRDLESLQHYLLIAQDERRVEVYSREAKRWSLQVVAPPDVVVLPAIAARLTFDEIYEDSGA